MRAKCALPPLGFAAHSPWEETDAEAMSERLNTFGTAHMEYRPRRAADEFRSLSAGLRVGRLVLSANSSTAVRYRATGVKDGFFIIPMMGEGETTQERRSVIWEAEQRGAYISCADAVGLSSRRSVVGVVADEPELQRLAQHMLDDDTPSFDFRISQSLPFGQGDVRFDALFRRLLAAVDSCVQEQAILDRSGLDDAFNRALVMWSQPGAFLTPKKRTISRPGLDNACEYILSNLDQKITLTNLEIISGMSPRVLQYSFRERFGCSPMQWVKLRRLEAVHDVITKAHTAESISTIASQYFSNLGEFSRRYKKHFGELPSETRSRRIGK